MAFKFLQVPKRVSQRLKINANGTETSAFRSIENGNNRFIPSPQISVESEELEALTSKPGTTCHWCRQKTTKGHVECTSESCGSQNRLRISFCEMCLRNRIGEDFQRAVECGNWICPKCRGSCGPGCNSCCNCGPCRKLLGLGPTYQMVKQARLEGFSNVHDYLIHKQTGEKPETIAARKHQYAWCR